MSTVHCPLCGLRFLYVSQLELHAREDHVRTSVGLPHREPVPAQREDEVDEGAPDHPPVLHWSW